MSGPDQLEHTAALTFTVPGLPKPQGSKKGFVVNGKAVLVDDNKLPLRSWRQDVISTALNARAEAGMLTFRTGPIGLLITFYLPRPQTHYGLRHGEHYLKPSAPVWVGKRPDLDKLVRAMADALTSAGVYHDDAQLAELHVLKAYAEGPSAELDQPGAIVLVRALPANNERPIPW